MRIIDGPVAALDVGKVRKRYLSLPPGGRDEHAPQRADIIAEVAHVPDVHGVPLPPLDRGGHVFSTDGLGHHVLHFLHAQPVAGKLRPVPFEIEKAT